MIAWEAATIAACIADVGNSLASSYPGARPLTGEELVRYQRRSPLHGWRIPALLDMPEIDLILPPEFPYALPRVALVDHNRDLPHSEHDGVLCLEPDDVTLNHYRPFDLVDQELARAAELVRELRAGEHQEDFTRDFERYWVHYATTGSATTVISLVEALPAAMRVHAATSQGLAVVSETQDHAVLWLKNWLAHSESSGERTPAILCPVPSAPKPSEYPSSGADVLSYLRNACPEGADLLRETIGNWPRRDVLVLIAVARAPEPDGLAAIRLSVSVTRKQGKKRFRGSGVGSNDMDLASQWLAIAKVERLPVRRAEPEWVHGRYTDEDQKLLSDKSVAVIGIGSLGAHVARLLAQAGIGNLALIDPDDFEMANASRHDLGADALGINKAEAVAKVLSRSLPHHRGIFGYAKTWRALFRSNPEVLTDADLILSLTGNWNGDAALSDLQQSTNVNMPPVIYGWVEPFACAAHAVLLKPGGACLRCHFSDGGVADRRVTNWPEDVETVPMCGAIHTPFGATAMGFAQAMVASMAIDGLLGRVEAGEWRVWTASQAEVDARGGAVDLRWSDVFGGLGDEPHIRRLPWRQSALCRACRRPSIT